MANYGYQYGTSPRKIEPDYNHNTKKTNVRKNKNNTRKNISKKNNVQTSNAKNRETKRKLKLEIRILVNALLIFSIIFAVIACQALAEQKYKEKENLLSEYNALCTKLNSSQESSEDLRTIAETYGMQAKAATMLCLDKEDYVEASTDDENDDEELSLYEKIMEFFK